MKSVKQVRSKLNILSHFTPFEEEYLDLEGPKCLEKATSF